MKYVLEKVVSIETMVWYMRHIIVSQTVRNSGFVVPVNVTPDLADVSKGRSRMSFDCRKVQ